MPYICGHPEAFTIKEGSGQCVELVKKAAHAPVTSAWKMGAKVRGNGYIQKGTAIATFDSNGHYPNKKTGNHAALYLSQDSDGILVWEQYSSLEKPQRRHIKFKGGHGERLSNDGDAYYVIE